MTYWPGQSKMQKVEKRFREDERDLAYKYALRLPPKFKIHVDCVNQGDEVQV